jgi:hypothetical protein
VFLTPRVDADNLGIRDEATVGFRVDISDESRANEEDSGLVH